MNIYDIPIITYHKISNQKEFGLTTVFPDNFKKQVQLLIEKGYQTITFQQFSENSNLPEKPIIISFDDTYKSVYQNAFPIMQDFNYRGVIFVISDYIGKMNNWEAYAVQRNHLHANADEIKEMLQNGFEIGSHSKNHKFLPLMNAKEIEEELNVSKKILENNFNVKIKSFCYPFGGYNKRVVSITDKCGFDFGVGNIKFNLYSKPNQLSLQRRSIYSTDGLTAFYKKVRGPLHKNISFLSEWLIQKGAYAGIIKSKLYNQKQAK